MSETTLPLDIITEILSKLPVKPLIRFRSVSKLWNTLINSPNFTKLHLSKTLISDNQNPNLICSSFTISTATITTATTFRFVELHHPLLQFPDHLSVKFLGSCNGVVSISSFFGAYTCLYNPTIETHRFLPDQPSRFPKPTPESIIRLPDNHRKTEDHLFVYGFGYDSVNDDYKLLRILEFFRNSVFVGSEVCLFSLKNNSWKYIDVLDNVYLNCSGLQECSAALFNEDLYFIVNDGKITPFVRCFNLQTETFSIMDLPKFDKNFYTFYLAMGEVDGCLSFFVNYLSADKRLMRADFWIMKEEGWVMLFSISDTSRIGASVDIIALVYSKDRQKILLRLDARGFGWYDWEKKDLVRVLVHGLSTDCSFDAWTYVESLVSFGNQNYNSKGKTTVPNKKKKVHPKKCMLFLGWFEAGMLEVSFSQKPFYPAVFASVQILCSSFWYIRPSMYMGFTAEIGIMAPEIILFPSSRDPETGYWLHFCNPYPIGFKL